MFEASDKPAVFGVPPGADFPRVLTDKIRESYASRPPEDLARLTVFVSTRRMQRRMKELFQESAPCLLPKMLLVTEIDRLLPGVAFPPTVPSLRRRLELAQLTAELIKREPDLAHSAAAVDLADSLARLLDEMQGQGVSISDMEALPQDGSFHWQRSLKFLKVADLYLQRISTFCIEPEAKQRIAVEELRRAWEIKPPRDPVIVAGSTGSRATTSLLMALVAEQRNGALVLPGYDFDLPPNVLSEIAASRENEDHPQYRFAALLQTLGLGPNQVERWGVAPNIARSRLISLSLRPAGSTGDWLSEAPKLGELGELARDLTLIEAANPREESIAIAVAIRSAIEDRKVVALITPDRVLTRRVAATLARWNIIPDDSAGVPLSLTPSGRLLRHIGRLVGALPATEELLALLKHPLVQIGDRGPHLKRTRELELYIRRKEIVRIGAEAVQGFARDQDEATQDWAHWLGVTLDKISQKPPPSIESAAKFHTEISEWVCGATNIWNGDDGEASKAILDRFLDQSDFSHHVTFPDYLRLFEQALAAESTRDANRPRPDVMIWGTLEARVMGADLVILGGLNEGTWPEAPDPDPWLNRAMRRDLGLLIPDRQIGLAAHDFQQAASAKEVVFSRSRRSEDSETIPSRWLNRLTNLLGGLPDQNGPETLDEITRKGDRLRAVAATIDSPMADVALAARPAPAPPSIARPKKLSVTEIKTLIRDPYAIYAKHILGLRPLLPLVPKPDARRKGIVFHEIFEAFFSPDSDFLDFAQAKARFFEVIDAEFGARVPWAATAASWRGLLSLIADPLIASEQHRRQSANPLAAETVGLFPLPGTDFTIKGKADRLDQHHDGGLVIYDYKTGTVPTAKQVRYFDRQLLIEALMAVHGAFQDIPASDVREVAYIDIGKRLQVKSIDLDDDTDPARVLIELTNLLTKYASPETGYISRRAMEKERFEGDYDHLARFGEWDASETTKPRPVS